MGELVEDFASYSRFGSLVWDFSVFQMVAKATFHTIHGRFRKTSAMVADSLLPLSAAASADFADRRIPRQRTFARVAMLPNLRVPTRRNDRSDAAFPQRFVGLAFVVSAVAIKSTDLVCRLIQQIVHLARVIATVLGQGFGFDLVRVRVHRQMQFPPCAAFALAVLAHLPFAFAENLQAGAIDHHVDPPGVFRNVERDAHFGGPLGQRRVVGNVEFDLHQFDERFAESFGLTIGQLKQLSQDEQTLDGGVAVDKRMPDSGVCVVVTPFFDRFFAKPEGNRPALHERLVVFAPICDFVRTFPCTGHVETPFRRLLFFKSSLFYVLNA